MKNGLLYIYLRPVLLVVRMMKQHLYNSAGKPFETVLVIPILWVFVLVFSIGYTSAMPTHLDISKIPGGCNACHSGHGKSGTPMLKQESETFCFTCHSKFDKSNVSKGTDAADIYSEIMKSSSHPVLETSRYHVRNEILPEINSSAPRHVSCLDCHDIHMVEKEDKMKGVIGYSGRGSKVRRIQKRTDYALCYNCHSDSANLPYGSNNISQEFDPVNGSFHPVESIGKGRYVPSLKKSYTTSSVISCTDCHGNDDDLGPQGPHGSRYSPILRYNYYREEGSESITAYELCYECHERSSILNDESFRAHKQHVVYGSVPCSGCHSAHGSRDNGSLIKFREPFVSPTKMGQLNFFTFSPGKPKCFLVCHVSGKDFAHGDVDGRYCVNSSCPPGW